jgi:type II secretory pathway component GspD/PulD (secretin)
MLIRMARILPALFIILLLASVASARQAKIQAARPGEPSTEAGLKAKMFEIKYANPGQLMPVLKTLASKDGTIIYNEKLRILTVRDYPENLAAIEAALRTLDKPGVRATEPDVELHIHVLLASSAEGAGKAYPSELQDVLKQLDATLSYRSYYLVTSIVQRVKLGGEGTSSSGSATLGPPLSEANVVANYQLSIEQIVAGPDSAGGRSLEVRRFAFVFAARPPLGAEGRITTHLGLRDGEKVVVGTASMKDKALIVVLSAKVLP